MRNFIVSDLHGNGNIYSSIIKYLENVSEIDEVTLYINGDLIDRGTDSGEMLMDVIDRIRNNKKFKIEYLAGNHELMMYQASKYRRKDNYRWPYHNIWFANGAETTAAYFETKLTYEEENDVVDFISNLKLYHKFNEKLNGKPIVLVHAKCPKEVKDECDLIVKDNNFEVSYYVWTRRYDDWGRFMNTLGNEKYFTILGHTPVNNEKGYEYNLDENYLNIDGGCAKYACGLIDFDHTPLVEIDEKNDRLVILTFNNDNEIINGHYFTRGISYSIKEDELNNYRSYLDQNKNVKELVLKENNN